MCGCPVYVDGICLVIFVDWLELWLGWAGGCRGPCSEVALVGWVEFKWVRAGAFLSLFAEGALAGQMMLKWVQARGGTGVLHA